MLWQHSNVKEFAAIQNHVLFLFPVTTVPPHTKEIKAPVVLTFFDTAFANFRYRAFSRFIGDWDARFEE